MRIQLDLRRLRYIVEIARAESITTAAETLGLTQPALTRSLSEVESLLGTRLFHRLPRGMQVTETGSRFAARARQILSEVDDLVADVSHSPETVSGRLRLGITPSSWLPYARPALTALAVEYPGVKIEIVSGTVQELYPRLARGELTSILATSTYLKRWRELEVIPLIKLKVACIVRANHPVTQIPCPKEADLLEYPLIMPSSVDPIYSDTAQRYLHNNLPTPAPHYITDDVELIKDLVRSTDAYHPITYSGEVLLDDGLVILHDVISLSEHQVSIAFANSHPKTEVALIFERLMRESVH